VEKVLTPVIGRKTVAVRRSVVLDGQPRVWVVEVRSTEKASVVVIKHTWACGRGKPA
jgi:hypothetical protein